ncbi:hypothetical protein MKW92_015933 [Papaver armeniacum]|nr:hypothetical protein MKW92_015933 [Papaver armeniacum]
MAKSIISKIFSTTFLFVLMIMISYTAGSALGDLLTVDITNADVGSNGNIVKVKPTTVQGICPTRVGTKDVHTDKKVHTAIIGDAQVSVAPKVSSYKLFWTW